MEKIILSVIILFNIFYIINYFIYSIFVTNNYWNVLIGIGLILSIVVSIIFLTRSLKESNNLTFMCLIALTISIGSFGWYIFSTYIYSIMG